MKKVEGQRRTEIPQSIGAEPSRLRDHETAETHEHRYPSPTRRAHGW